MFDLNQLLKNGPVFLDGATGTYLQKAGMPAGACPEQWIIENKDVLIQLQRAYKDAGSHIVYAPTFGGNRIKLEEYGLEDQLEEMNRQLVEISREAVQGQCYVAGNLTMTGRQLKPTGDLELEELIDCYKEQAAVLYRAGVDLIVVETMMDIGEARAALIAVKETCDLPVIVSMTFEASGKTLYGTEPLTALVTLQALGADAVGINCSTGPDTMVDFIRQMKPYARVPLLVKPNAGLPEAVDGETVFSMDKDQFATCMKDLVEAGAAIIGGCCGTTPDYIRQLSATVKGMPVFIPDHKKGVRMLTNERACQSVDLAGQFLVVGERINPTGKKKLKEELKEGNFDLVSQMAVAQVEAGAHILDVNVGMNGIDERETMIKAIEQVNAVVDIPLCIDSSSVEVIEAALRCYHGRALVNSVSCEKVKIERLLPIVKKYGAMFVLLPLTDSGLPKDAKERIENIRYVMHKAFKLGMTKEDIVVDGLVATIGAEKQAALQTLETIRYCRHELELATICGLSNISFGLPDRTYVNSTFLAMGIQNGLTMAIVNPSQDILMRTALAADLLTNKSEADIRYIEYSQSHVTTEPAHKTKVSKTSTEEQTHSLPDHLQDIYQAVLKGRNKKITNLTQKALDRKDTASKILNEALIPAIKQVGDYFNEQKYFLPQLMMSAQTMKTAVDYLEPHLVSSNDAEKGPVVILATVKGDIHDIGKNLVAMMMKNYGYTVIDLGKDVPKEEIIQSAKENNASIIGLSALMTTTMPQMKEVITLARQEKLSAKIIIGGAVITQDYADEIGADGYSQDAVSAVKLVASLLKSPR